MLPVKPKTLISMHTRDRTRLDADVYYPDAPGSFPVLLMRQPYGRAIASTVVYAHPSWYAAHGYIVVIQDVRGRGSSEGDFDLFMSEIEDGYDTVEWAATLPGSTGEVGMYGFSYQGMTQLFAAAAQPPALKTICPAMVAYDLHADWAYEGGAFCYQLNLGWATQLAAETARRKGDTDAYNTLYAAARNLDLRDPVCPHSALLASLAPDSFYHDWVQYSDPTAEYWQVRSPKTYLNGIDLPMLHIGGWYDTHLRGSLKVYQHMSAQSSQPQHLWIGPWAHLPWGRQVGAADYGSAASSPIDECQIRWFDHFLKHKDTGLLQEHPVHLFEMGSNRWLSLPHYPDAPQPMFRLQSNGLACMGDRHGQLIPSDASTERTEDIADAFVHDPWRPVPSSGGHATMPAGMSDRTALDSRTDVVTYTTAPLTEPLHLAGTIQLTLQVTADAPSFDLSTILSDVSPDGRVLSFTQGYQRTDTPANHALDKPLTVQITLQPTCIRLSAGHSLRLSLSAAAFPAYAVNPGTGDPPAHSRLIDARVITLSLHKNEVSLALSTLLEQVE
ncbi:MAG: CocE/NonD family hydrolase [Cyanobacteria bacterium J06638_22]